MVVTIKKIAEQKPLYKLTSTTKVQASKLVDAS